MSRSKTAMKYGTFGESMFLSSGEPYNDKDPMRSSRHSGLNMIACRKKTGKGNKAAFDDFKPLYANREKYKGVMTVEERRERHEKKSRGVIQPVMKPPGRVRSKTTGLGSYDGALGGKVEYMEHGDPESQRKQKGDFPDKPRNITTKPGKKGSYGTRGVTISETTTKLGVAGEYAYVAEEYDVEKRLERERRSAGKKKEQGNPFRPPAPGKKGGLGTRGTTLGGAKGVGVVGEYRYEPEGPEVIEITSPPEKAWRVSKPNRGAINKPPRYAEDPAELKEAAARELREQNREKMNEKPFVPLTRGGAKQSATPSVTRMNFAKVR
jgi:hypothetical protein